VRGVGYRGPSSSLHMRPTGCAGPPADRSRIKDQCHPFFSKAPRAVSHAFCHCQHRPIPRHLAEMSGRPSATSIELAIRSCVSRHVGPLARTDAPPTGRAGPMFGPAGRPTESHVSSGRETILSTTICAAGMPRRSQIQHFGIAQRGRRSHTELVQARAVFCVT